MNGSLQAVTIYLACCRLVTAEPRFQSHDSPRWIFYAQHGSGNGFSPSTSVIPCQYHSTNAPLSPVSTIPPTLHSPLSVPFHQCSIFVFILMLLLSEGQAGEEWILLTKQLFFLVNRKTLDRKVLKFSEGYTAILQ
jgi:hypothetical protein